MAEVGGITRYYTDQPATGYRLVGVISSDSPNFKLSRFVQCSC